MVADCQTLLYSYSKTCRPTHLKKKPEIVVVVQVMLVMVGYYRRLADLPPV